MSKLPLLPPARWFLLGHNLSSSGIYFNEVLMVAQLSQALSGPVADAQLFSYRDAWFEKMKKQGPIYVKRLTQACDWMEEIGIEPPMKPKVPKDYFNWVGESYRLIVSGMDLRDIRSVPFTYGYTLGEVLCDLVVIERSMLMIETFRLDFRDQVATLIDDLKNILFRWGPSGTLLGSDEKYYPLWQAWKPFYDDLNALTEKPAGLSRDQFNSLFNKGMALVEKSYEVLGGAAL